MSEARERKTVCIGCGTRVIPGGLTELHAGEEMIEGFCSECIEKVLDLAAGRGCLFCGKHTDHEPISFSADAALGLDAGVCDNCLDLAESRNEVLLA